MTFHPEILSDDQKSVLNQIAPILSAKKFYLAGGTASALMLGHRRSMDFDWFCSEPLSDPEELYRELLAAGFLLTEMSTAPGTLYVKVDGVWNSFMQYLYPLLEPLISIAEHRIELSSFADITAMKLEAIVQRGARKDFIDIYAIGTTTMPLSEMLNCYRRKYKTDKISHILVSLTYFNDADLEPMPDMVWDVTWKEIKRTIQEWVRDLVG